MATVETTYDALTAGQQVVLTLGGTRIEGKVKEITALGNPRIKIKNNKNTVVLTHRTNFTIEVEQEMASDVLDGLEIGEQFEYLNKYGKTFTWIKTGEDRYTKVESGRPATSFSKLGFPAAADKVTVL